MIALLHAMEAANCRTLVFSSSATVYGDPASVPITEDFARSHANPYGHGKLVCEDMLTLLGLSNKAWRWPCGRVAGAVAGRGRWRQLYRESGHRQGLQRARHPNPPRHVPRCVALAIQNTQ